MHGVQAGKKNERIAPTQPKFWKEKKNEEEKKHNDPVPCCVAIQRDQNSVSLPILAPHKKILAYRW
jgi:hypothetical protein